MIIDQTNKVIWRWDSDPFGSTAANEDPDGDGVKFTYNLRFPGQYYDRETGLHYNYFRDYDPRIGRYVSSDPISIAEHVQRWSALRATQNLTQFRDHLVGLGGIAELALAGSTLPPLELNPYAFVANNPLLWTDPTGESILQCGDPKKEKNCATLRDNIINQTCKSITNPKKKFACFAAAWATYLACMAQD